MMRYQTSTTLAILLMVSCTQGDPNVPNAKFCEYEKQNRERLLAAVEDAGVEVFPGVKAECFEVAEKDFAKVKGISKSLFGAPPPAGRSIGSSDGSIDEYAAILEKNNIPFQRYEYKKIDYIIWAFQYGEKVEKILPLLPEERAMLRNIRLESQVKQRYE